MESETIKRYCSNCQTETQQSIILKEIEISPAEVISRNENGDENESAWVIQGNTWIIAKCRGCEKLNMSIETKYVGGEEPIRKVLFPQISLRKIPTWTFQLPIKYVQVLSEVYTAINERIYRLALMGSRLLIETFIHEKVGDIGTFKQKLSSLETEGYISKKQKDILGSALDAGNAASHRGFNPDEKTINNVMDIVENLIQSEILERKATDIKIKTPKRN